MVTHNFCVLSFSMFLENFMKIQAFGRRLWAKMSFFQQKKLIFLNDNSHNFDKSQRRNTGVPAIERGDFQLHAAINFLDLRLLLGVPHCS